jgi:hypothetical protein
MFVALVRKNKPLERSTMRFVDMPARWSSQPPTASAPTPPPGTSAPEPISVQASRRAVSLGTRSKKRLKITTKLAHEANSSATAATTQPGVRLPISSITRRNGGTASSSDSRAAANTIEVTSWRTATRLPMLDHMTRCRVSNGYSWTKICKML